MAEPSTAMRDPVFYRWHNSMNDIFFAYKDQLTPYTVQQVQHWPIYEILTSKIIWIDQQAQLVPYS